jgi:ribosomal protein S18 acetylase RimI-like enzyme
LIALPLLPPLPGLPLLGIAAARLGTGQEAAVTTFCRQCSDFFTLVAGQSLTAETTRHLLESRPPGVEPAQKHLIGFKRGDEIVAIVDLLEGFPRNAEWYVGLLLLAPTERARGLGTAVWNAMESWLGAAGGRHIRLIVQEQNPAAAQFWRSRGFTASGKVEQVLATRTNQCWRFEKQLAAPAPQANIQ